ncbi:YgaP family membrane protein [Spirochaeta isovalerica]|uniref:Inner membrane protein YgaP-like transmembrane domain-containing protein n=1 Tax=Spirochaeta isovalerica TaxID=150 RepID=A0A841RDE1_9SPIO|nr:DUF2892 domain-containing protein [Spirochaeta isovalerica]MBB6480658.1 hypothetical protein [Spirochaeta isovalerica]
MKNMGKTDRLIRFVAGIILIAAAVYLQISSGRLWWLGIPGGIFLGTSLLSFCPLYLPFKINTGKKD